MGTNWRRFSNNFLFLIMASLVTTSVSGTLKVTGELLRSGNTDITSWYKLYHCESSGTYSKIHVRTPLPADTSSLGWQPSILEVYGHHTYGGDKVHDFKALLNVNGYNNDWYGSQIMRNDGYNSNPVVYRSTNTYGGKTRVCFSVNQASYCGNGWLFVRWWNNSAYYTDYAWAKTGSNSDTGAF
jgi:hypothetical protein